jgi:hypothetical protein
MTTIHTDTVAQAARDQLAFCGGKVLPFWLPPSGVKTPLWKPAGVNMAKSRPDDVVTSFRDMRTAGYCYFPGADIVVFDLDEKDGKSGSATIALLAQTHGPLPDTATVLSPSKPGRHLYFQLPPGVSVPCGVGFFGGDSGVDVFAQRFNGRKETTGWVAGPGSVAPHGVYHWDLDNGPEQGFAELPPAWIAALHAARPPKPPRDPSAPRADRERLPLSCLRDMLAAMDPDGMDHATEVFPVRAIAVESEVVNTDTGEVLDPDDVVGIVADWSARNPRFDPDAFDRSMRAVLDGLDDDTIDRARIGTLVEIARKHGYTGPAPAHVLVNQASLFKPVAGSESAAVDWDNIPEASGDDIMTGAIVRLTPVLGTHENLYLPSTDVTIFAGPGGTGKSTETNGLALDVSNGLPHHGLPTVQMPVLIVNFDDSLDLMKLGIRQCAHDRSASGITLVSMFGRDMLIKRSLASRDPSETPFHKWLCDRLGRMGAGPKLAILDHLGALFGGDYLNKAEIIAFIGCLRAICVRYNTTMVVLGHPSASATTSGDLTFGSAAWRDYPRMYWTFDYERDSKAKVISDIRILNRKKVNHGKSDVAGKGLRLEWEQGQFVLEGRDGAPPAKVGRAPAAELHVVRQAANMVLAGDPHHVPYSRQSFAEAVSAYTGRVGNTVLIGTLLRTYLPALIEEGYPGFVDGKWRYQVEVNAWKGSTPEAVKKAETERAAAAADTARKNANAAAAAAKAKAEQDQRHKATMAAIHAAGVKRRSPHMIGHDLHS